MKIICTQENLNQGLSIVSNLSNKNPNLPILNNVLIKAKQGVITLTSTNLEMGINCIIRGKIDNDGNFTIPAKTTTDYVNLIKDKQVNLNLKDNEIELITSNNKTRFKGVSSQDFPTIPEIKKENKYTTSVRDFKDCLNKIIFAVANTSSRPEINGAVFDFNSKNKMLTVAATDSYRLAEQKISLKNSGEDKRIIVPGKTLQEVVRILGLIKETEENSDKGDVNIYISNDNQILFTFSDTKIGADENIELISRLIEGNYPEYQEIIPENHNTEIIVNKNDLINTVKKSSLFTKNKIDSIKLNFLKDSNELTVYSANAETGENLSKLQVKIKGEDNEIVLNYHYLLDGLQHIDGDDVILEVINKDVPCVLRSAEKNNYLYIIMPIRL
ncbi:DNA polymerase III subunit beta [Candidatus Falkowbacteria bacterium]|jgi:DNA polymerase III subunit beta|nr:DNA polymerase III subunit beta [Candidatus Falkowbacteria bacterium]MBT4432786.1 DNA polymerase III subunit beta [Candidatus Falkowbacteria bacterium]